MRLSISVNKLSLAYIIHELNVSNLPPPLSNDNAAYHIIQSLHISSVFQLENEKGRAPGRALWAGRAHFRAL